jgi:hypothetical protein
MNRASGDDAGFAQACRSIATARETIVDQRATLSYSKSSHKIQLGRDPSGAWKVDAVADLLDGRPGLTLDQQIADSAEHTIIFNHIAEALRAGRYSTPERAMEAAMWLKQKATTRPLEEVIRSTTTKPRRSPLTQR